MSTISASTTSTTAYKVTADTTGTLVFQTGASPTTAMTIGSDQSVTFAGAQTYTGAATFSSGITVQGLTVGKGAGAVSTNTAVGTNALVGNTTGSANSAFGLNSLGANTTGTDNTSLGRSSLTSSTTGSYNTAVGSSALAQNTTANYNTAVGYTAGYSLTTSGYNTMIGDRSGTSTTGVNNTFIGQQAGNLVTSGTKNTIIGRYDGNTGGIDIRTSSNYIVLSDGDGNPRGIFGNTGTTNGWVLTTTDQTNKINAAETLQLIGNTSTGTDFCLFFNCQTGTTAYAARMFSRTSSSTVGSITFSSSATAYNTSSDYRLKDVTGPLTGSGEFIDALQPKVGTWKVDGSRFVGFIAHEVQEVSPSSVIGEKDAVDEDGKPVHQAMEYGSAEFIANIVAELQSLRQRVAQLENQA